jgi:uncharacterized protein YlxW (UPF0749 family)
MTNPFANIVQQKMIGPVSVLCLLLGAMIMTARGDISRRRERLSLVNSEQRTRISESAVDLENYLKLQTEVDSLQKLVTRLQKMATETNSGSDDLSKKLEELNKQLQEQKALAGLTELEGPGVKVVLIDNPSGGPMPGSEDTVHDYDLVSVRNELFASGAEGVAVNGQRLISTSSFVCSGPTIMVDGVKIAPPFVFQAVGNPETLYGGFTMNGRVMTELTATNPKMVEVTKVSKIRIPAFLGSTKRAVAVVPKESS